MPPVQMPVPFVAPCDNDCANILMKATNSGYIMKSILKEWGQPEGDEDGRDPNFHFTSCLAQLTYAGTTVSSLTEAPIFCVITQMSSHVLFIRITDHC